MLEVTLCRHEDGTTTESGEGSARRRDQDYADACRKKGDLPSGSCCRRQTDYLVPRNAVAGRRPQSDEKIAKVRQASGVRRRGGTKGNGSNSVRHAICAMISGRFLASVAYFLRPG